MVGRGWLRPRRLGVLLCLLGFVWGVMVINFTLVSQNPHKSSQALQDEILELSARYVKALAEESHNTIDGPYAGRLTGYDLKKTMAVLLENMMQRMEQLERRMDLVLNHTRNHTVLLPPAASLLPRETQRPQPSQRPPPAKSKQNPVVIPEQKPINAKDLLLGAQEECGLTEEQKDTFPHCLGKIEWMRSHWQSDKCYSEFGVDGSECSFRVYLSEVETWCPLLRGRKLNMILNETQTVHKKARLNLDLYQLLRKLEDPGQRPNYDWMRIRITRMWPNWVAAAERLAEKQDLSSLHQKRILVHLGLLSSKAGFRIAEGSLKGGPLGELVQWSDIIAALYILGHELTITSEVEQLTVIVAQFPTAESQCQNRDLLPIDMIFTDIVGLTQFKRKVRSGYGKFSCLLRIIDSFGTEPAFNLDYFAKSKKLKTQWGMQNLNPKQFYTMFPHSPDNSFMGFVVEQHLNESEIQDASLTRKNSAVVYGKAEYMWQSKDKYLSIFHKQGLEVHGTVFQENKAGGSTLPGFIHNHGILPGPELHRLLRQSKLFIGLGFPYEGPAPLEAIAQGNVFINPQHNPPHNSENTKFFKGKPTKRKLTSQHPYVEEFIGEPHVFTVDMTDAAAVSKAIQRAVEAVDTGKVSPYMPYEFQAEGMLQRLSAYLAHQDFCNPHPAPWPPDSDVTFHPSRRGESCKDACRRQQLICEPSHFSRVNTAEAMSTVLGGGGLNCRGREVKRLEDIYYPAYNVDAGVCVVQAQHMLFSCVGESAELVRVCPCRTYIPGQAALCKNCL